MQENYSNSEDSEKLKTKVEDSNSKEKLLKEINTDGQIDTKLGSTEVFEKETPKYVIDIRALAAFIEADDKTKLKKVTDTIYPSDFLRDYYTSAKSAITNSILKDDLSVLDEKLNLLRNQSEGTPHSLRMRDCSIRALEVYPSEKMPFKYRTLLNKQKVRGEKEYLDFMGIRIKIKPNLILRGEVNGVKSIGGVKLHTNKSEPLNSKQMRVLSFFLYKYLEDIAKDDEQVDIELCLGIDVFNQAIQNASFEHSTLVQTLKREIVEFTEVWNQIIE